MISSPEGDAEIDGLNELDSLGVLDGEAEVEKLCELLSETL